MGEIFDAFLRFRNWLKRDILPRKWSFLTLRNGILLLRNELDFDTVNFPFLDGDVPRSTSYGVCISQLIQFARVSSHLDDFKTRNKVLTAKLLKQGYRYIINFVRCFQSFIDGIVVAA